MSEQPWATADLSDAFPDAGTISTVRFRAFGRRRRFCGPISTIRCPRDNSRVREAVAEPGEGRVLFIDGGMATDCALLGDQLAQRAADNGWAGVIVRGCIRDSALIDQMDIGVLAIGTCPRKTIKRGLGDRDVPLYLPECRVFPGDQAYVDGDGIVVAGERLD